jgi:hypothetical protein
MVPVQCTNRTCHPSQMHPRFYQTLCAHAHKPQLPIQTRAPDQQLILVIQLQECSIFTPVLHYGCRITLIARSLYQSCSVQTHARPSKLLLSRSPKGLKYMRHSSLPLTIINSKTLANNCFHHTERERERERERLMAKHPVSNHMPGTIISMRMQRNLYNSSSRITRQ